jgi:hypothetical protein
VEQLFSKASGQNLKPFFDFYTRTTDVLDIVVKQTGYQKYSVSIRNLFMPLPIDITTPAGTEKKLIDKEGLIITSAIPPVVDGKGYYLKKIVVQ